MAAGARPKSKGGHAKRETAKPPAPAGLAARVAAVRLIAAVMHKRHSLDDALAKEFAYDALAPRDRAHARVIAGTVLRHAGELKALLASYLEKPPPEPSGKLWPILLAGAAQLLFLETPPHAAVGLAVEQARLDPRAKRYDRLVNAVLRRVSREGTAALQDRDAARQNIPAWLFDRWSKTYGEADARRIALASLCEAPLDVSVKSDAELWAERLGGTALPTGSVRLAAGGRIEDLAGYAEGAWWVQDAAAAVAARLLGDVSGRSVADLCAAPGGKTAELAAAGAHVTAVEQSAGRLARLRANLERLQLQAELVEADAATWAPGKLFDAVLLDAPCTSTGTIRRHPDILHLKRPEDVAALAALQSRLIDNAARLVTPGGMLVYCTCSLEPEEGPAQIARLLSRAPEFARVPIAAGECGIPADWLTAEGDLRTLPFHMPYTQKELSGLDGFYAARLVRRA
ncbi:MAG: RsmB/NOP family class I SAM-dependent RNA methyltransferase [Hyphomicrobium sp.]